MEIRLKALTPIWTGDIDSKSDSIQSTGIIGSLRWWTEAILRGTEKFVCNPADDNRCPIKVKKNNKEIALYCPACLIFGATGLRRMFKLKINGGKKLFSGGSLNIKPQRRNRGWYLGSGLIGEINLDIISLHKDFEEHLILIPLSIATKWGTLGAKTQHGYGVLEFINKYEVRLENFVHALNKVADKNRFEKLKIKERSGNNNLLPNIKEMFFAKVQFEVQRAEWWKEVDGITERGQKGNRNYYEGYINDPRMINWINAGSIPTAPAIKNWMRFGQKITNKPDKNLQVFPYKEVSNREISQWLFGRSDEDNKTASKISISCAYQINHLWEFRIWGWIPKNNLPDGFNRDIFLENLKTSLNGNDLVKIPWNKLLGNQTKQHKLKVWREFNSSRDTVSPNQKSMEKYLESLIKGEEGNQ